MADNRNDGMSNIRADPAARLRSGVCRLKSRVQDCTEWPGRLARAGAVAISAIILVLVADVTKADETSLAPTAAEMDANSKYEPLPIEVLRDSRPADLFRATGVSRVPQCNVLLQDLNTPWTRRSPIRHDGQADAETPFAAFLPLAHLISPWRKVSTRSPNGLIMTFDALALDVDANGRLDLAFRRQAFAPISGGHTDFGIWPDAPRALWRASAVSGQIYQEILRRTFTLPRDYKQIGLKLPHEVDAAVRGGQGLPSVYFFATAVGGLRLIGLVVLQPDLSARTSADFDRRADEIRMPFSVAVHFVRARQREVSSLCTFAASRTIVTSRFDLQ